MCVFVLNHFFKKGRVRRCLKCFHQNLSFMRSIWNRTQKCILRCGLTRSISVHLNLSDKRDKNSLYCIKSSRHQISHGRLLFLADYIWINFKRFMKNRWEILWCVDKMSSKVHIIRSTGYCFMDLLYNFPPCPQ